MAFNILLFFSEYKLSASSIAFSPCFWTIRALSLNSFALLLPSIAFSESSFTVVSTSSIDAVISSEEELASTISFVISTTASYISSVFDVISSTVADNSSLDELISCDFSIIILIRLLTFSIDLLRAVPV